METDGGHKARETATEESLAIDRCEVDGLARLMGSEGQVRESSHQPSGTDT